MLGPTDSASLAWLAEHWGPSACAKSACCRRRGRGGTPRRRMPVSVTGSSPTARRRMQRSPDWGRGGRRCALRCGHDRPRAGDERRHAAAQRRGRGGGQRWGRGGRGPAPRAGRICRWTGLAAELRPGPTPSIWRASRSPTSSARWRRRWNQPLPRSRSPAKPTGWSWRRGWCSCARACCCHRRPRIPPGPPTRIGELTGGAISRPPRRSPPGSRGGRNLASTSSLAGNGAARDGNRHRARGRHHRISLGLPGPVRGRSGQRRCHGGLPSALQRPLFSSGCPRAPVAAAAGGVGRDTARMVSARTAGERDGERGAGSHHLATTVRRGEHIVRRSGTGARRLADRAAEGAVRHDHARGPYRGEARSDPGCGLNCGSR